jgi:DNA-binding transcriptional LysR family regulator
MKDLSALRLYTRVARLGSFSAAAREAGLSQSQVSRTVAELEKELGVRLLSRTTRAVVPTEAGTEFLSRLEPLLTALEEAGQAVREGGDLRGLLRMSMPTSFGVRDVIPHLSGFIARHPQLHIDLILRDQKQDLVRDAVDVSIRLGRLTDSSATSRLIATLPRVIVAAPTYLEQRGIPTKPEELSEHRIIGGTASAVPTALTLERAGRKTSLQLAAHFSTSDNEGAVAAAVAGLGVTSTSGWACRRELEEGSLVKVLADWKTVGIPVHAYCPMGRSTRSAARAVVAHLITEFAARDP